MTVQSKRARVLEKAALLCMTIGIAGCASTPDSVLQAGAMEREALGILQSNVNMLLDAYTDELHDAYLQGYRAWMTQREADLQDAQGKVNLADYKRMQRGVAERMGEINEYLQSRKREFKQRLAYQFAVAGNLSEAIDAYNRATGIPPETFRELVASTQGLAEDLVELERERRAEERPDADDPKWSDLLGLVERRAFDAIGRAVENDFDLNVGSGLRQPNANGGD